MYIKTEHEMALIIEGGRILGSILEKLAAMVQPGVSAWEIDKKAEQFIRKAGGLPAFKGYRSQPGDTPFPSTICASLNEEVVHGIPRKDKIFSEGDLFSIDIGMEYPRKSGEGHNGNGFITDTALTLGIGSISKEKADLIRATREALYKGISEIKVGASIAAIGRTIESYIKPQGYGIVRDLVGHGVGYALHEEPRVPNFYDRALERWKCRLGMVIAIEPMITMGDEDVETAPDGWTILSSDRSLSAHFEHTIALTAQGPIVATERPSDRF
ncbi:MAG: type I methionyl aminopeptidase [Candidatus Magasanikbacteria bacterium]|nr:type I methionyl aminopeptidase [Candidatus Magasanikbacteria bacterium]